MILTPARLSELIAKLNKGDIRNHPSILQASHKALQADNEKLRELLVDIAPAIELARMAARQGGREDYEWYCNLERRVNEATHAELKEKDEDTDEG